MRSFVNNQVISLSLVSLGNQANIFKLFFFFFLLTFEPVLNLGCTEVSNPAGISFYKPKASGQRGKDLIHVSADGKGILSLN